LPRECTTLVGHTTGRHALAWRAAQDGGVALEPGIYFLRMTGEGGRRAVVRFAVVR
jgi:hypothetical protein